MALTAANSAHHRLPVTRPPTADPTAEPPPLTGFEQMSPLIRLMIVCVPDTMPVSLLTSTWPTDHGAWIGGTPVSYLWVRSGVKPWQRRHLIGVRRSRHAPVLCAGGPIRWLDLDGMRAAAAFAAGVRHYQWTHVVRGTRAAIPWHSDPHRAVRHAERGDGRGVAPLHPPAACRRDARVYRRPHRRPGPRPGRGRDVPGRLGRLPAVPRHARDLRRRDPHHRWPPFCSPAAIPSPTASPTSITRCGCYTPYPTGNASSPSPHPTPTRHPPNNAAGPTPDIPAHPSARDRPDRLDLERQPIQGRSASTSPRRARAPAPAVRTGFPAPRTRTPPLPRRAPRIEAGHPILAAGECRRYTSSHRTAPTRGAVPTSPNPSCPALLARCPAYHRTPQPRITSARRPTGGALISCPQPNANPTPDRRMSSGGLS